MGRLRVKEHAFGREVAKEFLRSLHEYTLNTWCIYVHGKYMVVSIEHTHNNAVQREMNE